jgi:glycosyltransferase involved in cell wall biosynthesis
MLQKTVLIITDNLPDQINGVVTTYKNMEKIALLDGYIFVYLTPRQFLHFDCPRYNEIKLSIPWKLGQKIEQISPDHIHIATEGPLGVAARLYLDYRNRRYNTAYHTKFPEALKKLFGVPEKPTWAFVRWFHKHSGKVLTTTNSMVEELRNHGFDGEIVPWTRGVDRTIFNPSHRMKSKSKYLVCVSRISKEKNLDEFCSLNIPGHQLVMVGDGPYRDELQRKYPKVTFVGFRTGEDLARYYANAECFVFPSRWETFGIVMIESMGCGTPVAAYPTQGPIDVVQEGKTGCLNENLMKAVHDAMILDRSVVEKESMHWSWENCWQIFKKNLV